METPNEPSINPYQTPSVPVLQDTPVVDTAMTRGRVGGNKMSPAECAAQIVDAMKKKGLTKSAMAAEMDTTRAQLDRLLDADNDSVTLATLKRAAKALGKTLRLELA